MKVKIKTDIPRSSKFKSPEFIVDMERYCGMVIEVEYMGDSTKNGDLLYYGKGFHWISEWFTPVETKEVRCEHCKEINYV